MRTLREWLLRLAGTLRPSRPDDDLAEELRAHAALAAEHGHRVTGASQAMESLRDQRGVPWLDDLSRDLRHGARALVRDKAFTATALLALALGVGASAGVFTLLDQVLLRRLPVTDPQRLVQIEWRGNKVGSNYGSGSGDTVSYPVCDELERLETFDGVFCRYSEDFNVSTGGEHQLTRVEIVSGSYFDVLGVRPALGRLIGPSDNRSPGAHPVVVLSHDYWINRLGGAADVIGRRVWVNAYPMTVIGIATAGFRGIDRAGAPAVWIPAMMKRQVTPEWDGLTSRRLFWMYAIGRLPPGATADQARAQLQPWFRHMLEADLTREEFPPVTPEQRRSFLASTLNVVSAARGVATLEGRLERPLRVLMAGALLLLVLASLNVAGLLIARGVSRTREVATRMAVGASRARVARQLVVESLLLTLTGGALGVAFAPIVSRILRSYVPPGADVSAAIDSRVLLFALVASAVTGAICALAPVYQVMRLPLSAAMTERSGALGTRRAGARQALVAAQIAFALILLVTAGLFVKTLGHLYGKGPGFDATNLMMFSVDPTSAGYSDERAELAMREVLRRLRQTPEIERAAVAASALLNGGMAGGPLTIDVGGERRVTERSVLRLRVSPGFIETLGMQLVDGRAYTERDVRPAGTKPGRPRMAIVNEAFARRYFGGRSPVGARVGPGNRPDTTTDIEIVGVVREISRVNMRDRDLDQIFYNFWDNQSENGTFFVRVRNPETAVTTIGGIVAAVDPQLPVNNMTTLEDQIDRALFNERALAVLSSGFGAIAVLISVVGLYGVVAFMAAQRQREIGLRVALGATRRDAIWLVVREALVMVVAGVVVALPAVWTFRRLVETQLFDVAAFDAPTIVLASSGLGLVALGAAMLPAWRASRLDPNAVLRAE
jgi:predicted permease